MLVDMLIASVLGVVVLYMLLDQWCLGGSPPGMLVVLGDDAKKIPKPASTATTITTVSKDQLEAVEKDVHQATDGHSVSIE